MSLLLVVCIGLAAADHGCEFTTSDAFVETTATGSTLYIDADCPALPNTSICLEQVPVILVYEEANGIDGLQRDDTWADDTCDGERAPDRLIFPDIVSPI